VSGSPGIDSVIAEAIESALLGVRVAGVGIVRSYDAATQTCSVEPAVRRPVPTQDDRVTQEADSVVPNVMVAHWGTSALSVHGALATGDTVLLVYLDYSPALWRSRGTVSDTPDTHAHRYPVAIPFMRPRGAAGPDTDASFGEPDGTRVHFESGVARVGATTDPAADYVALAAKVDARLDAIEQWAASVVFPVTALGSPTGTAVPPLVPGGGSTAGTKLKSG
jgi:hypothetical protein